jgi:hypothetical protein
MIHSNMRFNIVLIVALLAGHLALAGEVLIITGAYTGKNLYVQNPILPDNRFSTEEVFVNEQLVLSNPMTSAYSIDLTHLKINQQVEIRIVHKDRFKPRIINAHVLLDNVVSSARSYGPVENIFRWINVDGKTIRWLTHGEKGGGAFEVQRALQEDWVSVGEIAANPLSNEMVYRFELIHQKGGNIYRIKLTDRDGYVSYSDPIEYKLR